MRRPRRPAKFGGGGGEAPLKAGAAVGAKDADGVSVIAVDGECEAPVLGFPVVAAAGDGGGEKASLEAGLAVVKDAMGISVIAFDKEGVAPVLGAPAVVAAGDEGGEKGPTEDGVAVGVKEALDGAPVIAANGKGEVSVQGDLVVPAVDRKVNAPVTERVPAIAVEDKGKVEKDEEGIKWIKHYSSAQSILIVGDGDLSFSLSLATAFGSGENLVATSLDSYGALTRKYAKAEMNITELKRLGATVLHGVDVKTMKLHSCLKLRRFDRIVFNFPHAGFKGKEDHLHVINAHKQLVRGFFANALQLLRPYGETHVSHKTGHPYDAWDIVQLAYESCLIKVGEVKFSKEDYPGYNQKRGDSARCDEPFLLGPCYTFMFCRDVKKLKQAHGNRVGSVSGLGDSKFYPGISATGMRPFDLHPLAPAWPQPHFSPDNRVHMPIPFDPRPFGVLPMEHQGFPVNCYGAERAPYFHQQDMVQPVCRVPPLVVVPSQGGFHPPMRGILANLEPPWIGDCSYSHQGYESLQKKYEIHRQQVRPLQDSYMESVQKRVRLEMLIQFYGRQ